MSGDKRASRHMWYMADAQLLVRKVQEAVWPLGYHVALGGGVLNHGYSDHDLDLYVLPLWRESESTRVQERLREVLEFQKNIKLDNPRYANFPTAAMESSDVYHYEGKRVDVFVIAGDVFRVAQKLQS